MNLTKTNWFVKFLECFFFMAAIVNTISLTLEFLPRAILARLDENLIDIIFYGIYIAAFLFAVGYAVYWHKKETKGLFHSEKSIC